MSKGNTFETDVLKLFFQAVAIADLAQDDGSAPATNLYVSLHTADPGEGGSQTTNEISYTGYARVAVARTAGGWSVAAGSCSPAAAITFGQMTAGAGGTVTHAAIGTGSAGAGYLMYSGTVTPNISVTNGVTPQLTTASTITED